MGRKRDAVARGPLLALLLAAGCADPVLPGRNNPLDPGGANYNNPGVELLAGPSDNAVIGQDNVTFRWRGTGKATQFISQLDSRGWTGWSPCDSARFRYLDDGNHQFVIDARTDIGIVMSALARYDFRVDAAPAPAVLSVPWLAQADSGGDLFFTMTKKGVGSLSSARLVLTYDPSTLLQITPAAGPCWFVPNGSVTQTDNSLPGVVDITIRLSSPGTGTSGNGLATLYCVAGRPVMLDSLVFDPGSYLIGAGGDTVALTARRGSVITITQ